MRETVSMIFFVIAATLFITYCNAAINLIRIPKLAGTYLEKIGAALGWLVILFLWLGFFYV